MTSRPAEGGWLACWLIALAATLGLFAVSLFASSGLGVMLGIVVASALWAAWDSARMRVQLYKTQMANEPVMILFMCVMLWIIMFPWYVVIREGIRRGLVPLKEAAEAEAERES